MCTSGFAIGHNACTVGSHVLLLLFHEECVLHLDSCEREAGCVKTLFAIVAEGMKEPMVNGLSIACVMISLAFQHTVMLSLCQENALLMYSTWPFGLSATRSTL